MNTPLFTSILYVDRVELFQTALDAFLCQERFLAQGQLIVVTPEDSAQVREALTQAEQRLHIPPVYQIVPSCTAPQAYNQGLNAATGQWINFTLASASFSDNTFSTLAKAIEQHNTIRAFSLCPVHVGLGEPIPYLIAPKTDKDISVDLNRQFKHLQMVLQAYFFQRSVLDGKKFEETIRDEALFLYLLCALGDTAAADSDLKAPTFRFLHGALYQYTIALEDNMHVCLAQYEKWWYTASVRDAILPFLRSFAETNTPIPAYIQHACMWLIGCRYRCNFNDINKHVLNEEEFAEFHQVCSQAMVYLDNQFIMQRGFTPPVSISLAARTALLKGKAEQMNCKLHLTSSGKEMLVRFQKKDGSPWDGRPDDDLAGIVDKDRIRFEVRLLKYEDGCLIFNGFLFGRLLITDEPFELYAITWQRGKDPALYDRIPGEQQDIYCLKKDFGQVLMKDYPVTFRIPVKNGKIQKIRFYLRIAGTEIRLQTTYPRYYSRLNKFPEAYWQFTKKRVLLPEVNELGNIIELQIRSDGSRKRKLLRELRYCKAFVNQAREQENEEQIKKAKRAVRIRALYFLTRPFFRKKRFWVSFDKLYKAGDNGEYMYQYGRERHGQAGVPEFCYIVNRTSPDYPRLKAQKHAHVLVEDSLRCFLTCMHAEVILATHVNIYRYFNSDLTLANAMRNLYRGKVVCVQHGLSINQIAHFQNQWFDDTVLYTCASPFEKQNLSSKYYGYQEKQLQLTGLARYDGLKNQDQKLILITPTWRKDLALDPVFGESRSYNPQFKESEYFRLYNTLINDPRLLETAKRTGYRIMYLLHPVTSSQAVDFTDNGYVEIVPAAGDMSYETVLTESSLMVTDYSGVQFDFAYQRKPLVYYHPDTLPPHYEEGGLIYDTMGFGPICKNHDEIVETLCQYMENGCKMLPEYVKRADDFFAFDDFKNCERIYHAVEEMLREKK